MYNSRGHKFGQFLADELEDTMLMEPWSVRRLILTIGAVIIFMAAGLVGLSKLTAMVVEQHTERAKLEKIELEMRLQHTLPPLHLTGPVPWCDFEITRIIRLDSKGGEVELSEPKTQMICAGTVAFDSLHGSKHNDVLVVSKCYPASQKPRVYVAGELRTYSSTIY